MPASHEIKTTSHQSSAKPFIFVWLFPSIIFLLSITTLLLFAKTLNILIPSIMVCFWISFYIGIFIYKKNLAQLNENKFSIGTQKLHSELELLKTRLIEYENLATLGTTLVTVTHEMNQPLNFISANISQLKHDLIEIKNLLDHYEMITIENIKETLPSILKYKEEINFERLLPEIDNLLIKLSDESKRAASIAKNLKNYTNMDDIHMQKININESIDSALNLLKHEYINHISVNKHYNDVPLLECYASKIHQALINIIANAIRLIPKNGSIDIFTKKDEHHLIMIIKDSSLRRDDLIKQYDKPNLNNYLNLELSSSHKIIQEHHGSIETTTDPRNGVSFIVRLPIMQPGKSSE